MSGFGSGVGRFTCLQQTKVFTMSDPISALATKQITQAISSAFDSPSKEIGNYIADKIRYLRYTSLLKIVKRAEERAGQAGMTLKMPPISFLCRFLKVPR